MTTHKPLLKIYADKQASHLALKNIERSAKFGRFITLLFAIATLYLLLNDVEDIWVMTLILCVISAGMSWMSYKTIPSYEKVYQELPLLYSFYPHGFISHQGEQDYSWEQISALQYSETSLNLKMKRNPHKIVELAFICVSAESLNRILHHFKIHAPKRLSGKLKL